MLDSLHDLRLAARTLRRVPGFSTATVVALAIGIAGTTLVFSIVNALLLRPLPYEAADSLVVIEPRPRWSTFEALREARGVSYAAYAERTANVVAGGGVERSFVVAVSREFLQLAGVRPVAGRTFLENEYRPGQTATALLTDAFWHRRFGRSPAAVGQTVVIDDLPHTIVGVLPREFRTLGELQPSAEGDFSHSVGLVVPLAHDPMTDRFFSTDRLARGLVVIGRLGESVGLEQARAELAVLAPRRAARPDPLYPDYTLVPLAASVLGDLWPKLVIVAVAVSVLLIVACVNVINLLLARAEGRRRKMATRLALGASFRQLTRHALAETVLLSAVGGALGVWLAWAGIEAVKHVAGPLLTRLHDVRIDLRVLAFAATVSIGMGLLVGVLPVLRSWRSKPLAALHSDPSAPGPTGRLPVSSLLVILQVALSVLLVVAGTMLAKDLVRLLSVDLGFKPQGVLTAQVSLSRYRYQKAGAKAFFDALVQKAAELPGVEAAGLVHPVPTARIYSGLHVRPEGRLREEAVGYRVVSGNYFAMLAIPLVAGRTFDERDTAGAPRVTVINETMAETYWGGAREALGRRILPQGTEVGEGWTVVGIVADIRLGSPKVLPEMYSAYSQATVTTDMTLLLRDRGGNPAGVAGSLADIVQTLDPSQPIDNVLMLDAIVFAHVARQRLLMAMVGTFAGLTLLLAGIGVYGVMAYSIVQRTREIAVRLALGCTRGRVLGLVLARGGMLIAAGVGFSLPLTLGLTWWFASEFVGVSGTDPGSYAASAAAIATVGVLALAVPVYRATLVDPLAVLRRE